jgi:hypothetical protein
MKNSQAGKLSLDLLLAPPTQSVSADRLFEEARVCLPKIYGSEYPVQEFMDDIENYRALSLLHKSQRIKLEVLSLGIASREVPVDKRMMSQLGDQIQRMGQVCIYSSPVWPYLSFAPALRLVTLVSFHPPA